MKTVRISSIYILTDALPRVAIDEDTVSRYKETYTHEQETKKEKLPPVTLGILSGSRTHKYILLEGLHRISSKKRLGDNYIAADIDESFTFPVESLESKEVICKILYYALQINGKHGLPISRKDFKESIIKLFRNGANINDLCKLASRTTIYDYLGPILKDTCAEKRTKAIKLLKEGSSKREVAQQLGLSTRSLVRWKKEEAKKGVRPTPETGLLDKNPDSEKCHPPVSHTDNSEFIREIPVRTNIDSIPKIKAKKDIDVIYRKIRDLDTSTYQDAWDDFLVNDLLPLLSTKSKTRDILKSASLASKLEMAMDENAHLRKQLTDSNSAIYEQSQTIKDIQDELALRKNHCRRECEYTNERLMKTMEQILASLYDDVNDHLRALANHQSKEFMALTENLLLKLVAQFEWLYHHNFVQPSTIKLWKSFERLIDERFEKEIIMKRIKGLSKNMKGGTNKPINEGKCISV